MIGKLSGVVDWKGLDQVLLDVRGVGYIVHVNDRTLASLPRVGEAAALYTSPGLRVFGCCVCLMPSTLWDRLTMISKRERLTARVTRSIYWSRL